MKALKLICLFFLISLLVSSCKKERLKDDSSILIGTWTSFPRICSCCYVYTGVAFDPLYKLELLERGNYRLFVDGKKVERGRLVVLDGYLSFKSFDLKKGSRLDGKKILKYNNDSLFIDQFCNNEYEINLVKK